MRVVAGRPRALGLLTAAQLNTAPTFLPSEEVVERRGKGADEPLVPPLSQIDPYRNNGQC